MYWGGKGWTMDKSCVSVYMSLVGLVQPARPSECGPRVGASLLQVARPDPRSEESRGMVRFLIFLYCQANL